MSSRTLWLAGASLLAGLCPLSPAEAAEGPSGASIVEITPDPAAPGRFYAQASNATYATADHGATWSRLRGGLPAPQPNGPRIPPTWIADGTSLHAADAGCRWLYRSTDHGHSWSMSGALPVGGCVAGLTRTAGANARFLVSNGPDVHASLDGTAFTSVATSLPSGTVLTVQANPFDDGVAFLVKQGSDGSVDLYRSDDDGAQWSAVALSPEPMFDPNVVVRLVFGPQGRIYFFPRRDAGFRSDDGGLTWSVFPQGAVAAAVHPLDPDTVYLIDHANKLLVTEDGGATFSHVYPSHLIVAGPGGPARMTSIAIDPLGGGHNLIIGTAEAGLFKRYWATWSRVEGNFVSEIRPVAFHPHQPGHLLAGSQQQTGIFRGVVGQGFAEASSAPRSSIVRALAFDPTMTDPATTTVYAGGRRAFPIPGEPFATMDMWKSNDGGVTWNDTGYAYIGVVRDIALDRRSCMTPPPGLAPCTQGPLQTIYATSTGRTGGTASHRIIKSQDAGATWIDIDTLPRTASAASENIEPIPITIDPFDSQTLYVGTLWQPDATPTPTLANGIFRSTDGGTTWALRSNGLPLMPGTSDTHHSVFAIAADPSSPSRLWAAVSPNPSWYEAGAVVYRSLDGGANWALSNKGITAGDVRAFALDPTTPSTIYAAAAGRPDEPGGVYRSTDSGTTWRSISAGLGDAGASIAVDPGDPTLLATGTQHGVKLLRLAPDADGDGVPDAVEQSGPGQGDANGDGIPDAGQAHVASIDAASTLGRWLPEGGAIDSFDPARIVIDVEPDTAGTCSQLVDAQVVHPRERLVDTDAGAAYLHDTPLLRFEILDCPGANVVVSWPGTPFATAATWRFHGPSMPGDSRIGWHDFSAQATRLGPSRWRLRLDRGAFGSYRPAGTGSILFEGRPATPDRIFTAGFDLSP